MDAPASLNLEVRLAAIRTIIGSLQKRQGGEESREEEGVCPEWDSTSQPHSIFRPQRRGASALGD